MKASSRLLTGTALALFAVIGALSIGGQSASASVYCGTPAANHCYDIGVSAWLNTSQARGFYTELVPKCGALSSWNEAAVTYESWLNLGSTGYWVEAGYENVGSASPNSGYHMFWADNRPYYGFFTHTFAGTPPAGAGVAILADPNNATTYDVDVGLYTQQYSTNNVNWTQNPIGFITGLETDSPGSSGSGTSQGVGTYTAGYQFTSGWPGEHSEELENGGTPTSFGYSYWSSSTYYTGGFNC